MNYSIIVPVYNRPNELNDLLYSLCDQTLKSFEVIIVEDGSTIKSDVIVEKYATTLSIKYFFKENSGPGLSRNYGAEHAIGDYLIFLDSDCMVPKDYLQNVDMALTTNYVDAFGGPDSAHDSFSTIQKAINYSMTSFITTGGIRGNKKSLDKFYPRSFNMGYSREVYQTTKGFAAMRFGEDIDMSLRILQAGFKTSLIKEAFVYHKRRINFKKFYYQIFNSGMARIALHKKHPGSLKLVHLLPSIFIVGVCFSLILSLTVNYLFILPLFILAIIVFLDSFIKNKNLSVAFLSIPSTYIQLFAYGSGFLYALAKKYF